MALKVNCKDRQCKLLSCYYTCVYMFPNLNTSKVMLHFKAPAWLLLCYAIAKNCSFSPSESEYGVKTIISVVDFSQGRSAITGSGLDDTLRDKDIGVLVNNVTIGPRTGHPQFFDEVRMISHAVSYNTVRVLSPSVLNWLLRFSACSKRLLRTGTWWTWTWVPPWRWLDSSCLRCRPAEKEPSSTWGLCSVTAPCHSCQLTQPPRHSCGTGPNLWKLKTFWISRMIG